MFEESANTGRARRRDQMTWQQITATILKWVRDSLSGVFLVYCAGIIFYEGYRAAKGLFVNPTTVVIFLVLVLGSLGAFLGGRTLDLWIKKHTSSS
jgi:hypothetical protein